VILAFLAIFPAHHRALVYSDFPGLELHPLDDDDGIWRIGPGLRRKRKDTEQRQPPGEENVLH